MHTVWARGPMRALPPPPRGGGGDDDNGEGASQGSGAALALREPTPGPLQGRGGRHLTQDALSFHRAAAPGVGGGGGVASP